MNRNFVITATWIFDDQIELRPLSGRQFGDIALSGLSVSFTVNDRFGVVFNSEHDCKHGWEMSASNQDDSMALLGAVSFNRAHSIFRQMQKEAESLAKGRLNMLKEKWLNDRAFPAKVENQKDVMALVGALDLVDNDGVDRWVVPQIKERYPKVKFKGNKLAIDSLSAIGR